MRALVLVLVASTAVAGPLPKGTKIIVDKNQLWFVDGDIRVPVRDGDARERPVNELTKIDVDGDDISLTMTDCIRGSDDPPLEVSLAALQAKVENMRGMALQLKKKYTDAIPHFVLAAKGDPSTAMFATNLLSAQSLAGKLDDADQTLATYGPKNPPWFAWRLAVDSDLKPLRGRPSTKPFVADKPTKVAYKYDDVAVSPSGYVATDDTLLVGNMPGGDDGHTLAIYELKTNRKIFEHSISMSCIDNKELAQEIGGGCTKQDLAKHAAVLAEMSALLGALGFSIEKTAWVEGATIDDKTGALASPDKSVKLVFKTEEDGSTKMTIARGKASVTVKTFFGTPYRVGFTKSLVVLQYRDSYGCGGMDSRRFTSAVYALP